MRPLLHATWITLHGEAEVDILPSAFFMMLLAQLKVLTIGTIGSVTISALSDVRLSTS